MLIVSFIYFIFLVNYKQQVAQEINDLREQLLEYEIKYMKLEKLH